MRKFSFMAKGLTAVALCGIMMSGLAACGAGAEDSYSKNAASISPSYAGGSASNTAWSDGIMYDSIEVETEEKVSYDYGMSIDSMESINVESGEDAPVSTSSRKVIKTAYLNLQTLDFDTFATALEQKINETGSYMQYANVSGTDYYGGRKSADYTIRVPEARLDEFLAGMEGIATVTNKTLGEDDVTLSYVDTESRIKTLEIEQERLLALLEKAEDLESIIRLEERLSEVRYNIESYQSRLRTYDDKITYSTVQIYVYEVARVTEKEPETVWERIQTGWSDTMYDISMGAQDFFVWIIVNLPYLVFWGVVLTVLIVVLRNNRKKKNEKRIRKQSDENETEMDHKE